MSPSDLDLSLHPDADQIRRREFATVRRGYDADQVREYLTAVADQVRGLEERLHQERRRADEALAASTAVPPAAVAAPAPGPAPDGPDAYERLAQRLAGLIGTADREASRIVDEAKAEAAQMLEDARIEADRTRLDGQSQAEEARSDAERTLAEARETAERTLGGLERRRDELLGEIRQVQERLLTVAGGLGEAAATAEGPAVETSPGDRPAPIEVDLPDLGSIDLDFERDPDAG